MAKPLALAATTASAAWKITWDGETRLMLCAPAVGEAQHLGREFVRCQSSCLAGLEFLADLVVLAEDATEIAAGEEDGPGAACAGDGRLFAVVQAGVGDLRSGADPAEPRLDLRAG